MSEKHLTIEFHYASIKLEPYSGSCNDSSRLLKNLIQKLNDKDFPNEKRIIDRFENRKGTVKRRLVHISSPFEQKGIRCFGKIALIKNKAPMVWGGKDVIEHIEKDNFKEFIEITNYVINFNENIEPIIMVEFNSDGARLSDIEFYFRQILKDYKISKSIKTKLFLDTDYNELDDNLTNVFSVVVKLDSNKLIQSKKAEWYKSLKTLSDEAGYKDVRLELFYQRKKDSLGKYIKNIIGLDYARGIISWLKQSDKNIEYVDDLKMTYQVDDNQEPIELDFLKNKTTSIINIPLINQTQYRPQDFKHYVGQEFNNYLNTGKTNT